LESGGNTIKFSCKLLKPSLPLVIVISSIVLGWGQGGGGTLQKYHPDDFYLHFWIWFSTSQGYRWEPPTFKYSKQLIVLVWITQWVLHTIPYNHTSIQRAWHMIGYHKVENFQCW
jgi:hypothetical protein